MLISSAMAAATTAATSADAAGGTGATQAFVLNMMLILILVGLFYFMMIVPQQKRMRRHRDMLQGLRKGDAVITAGGLIGKVDKVKDGDDEVVIDLGNNIKVTAVRSTIQIKRDEVKDTK